MQQRQQRVKPAAACFGGGTSDCAMWICEYELEVVAAATPQVSPACIPIFLLLAALDAPPFVTAHPSAAGIDPG